MERKKGRHTMVSSLKKVENALELGFFALVLI